MYDNYVKSDSARDNSSINFRIL